MGANGIGPKHGWGEEKGYEPSIAEKRAQMYAVANMYHTDLFSVVKSNKIKHIASGADHRYKELKGK